MSVRMAALTTSAFMVGALFSRLELQTGDVSAAVPPVENRLFYSGVLVDSNGPAKGERAIEVRFFDASIDGNSLCVAPRQIVSLVYGAFRVNVSPCADSLAAAGDAFVEVGVDGDTLPPRGRERSRVGAVPYAVEAAISASARSVTGDVSTAQLSGTIEASQITVSGVQLQTMLDTLSAHAVPTGTIVAYGGGAAPRGWVVCDGAALQRNTHAALFAAIGIAWGAGDFDRTFNVPDLRGLFLRGVDPDSRNDPDAGSRRVSQTGGNASGVGSRQDDEVGRHSHAYTSGPNDGQGQYPRLTFNGGLQFPHARTTVDGGNESRPRNAAVTYIIKL